MKNILITGGAGFIGSRLCEKLFDQGNNITVLDNLSEQIHGNGESFLFNKIKDKCTFIKGDVRDKNDWAHAIKNQQIIIHLAAETGTGQSMYEIAKYTNVNVLGTSHMLEILANSNHNVKKIIVASSRSIYGEGKYNCEAHGVQYPSKRKEEDMKKGEFNPKCSMCNSTLNVLPTDEQSKIHPSSIYGINKQQQEQMVMIMGESLSISTVAFRYQNVYGPGQSLSNPYTGILSIFSTRILNGNNLDLYEDGEETRDFVYIEDVVDATILGIEKEEANGHVFNVGSGVSTRVIDVANTLKRLYNSENNITISGKFRLGDIRHNFADLSKLKDILGFTPKYNFERGITEFVNWVKTQEVMEDKYEKSIQQLKNKGLIK
ncbi:MAG: SDR family NAD(P)-dependent oxidoreductase [Flavobacteriales bacterium]|nr:SDR family NAD(P)-dependent oxidoreductase [Flavobacteriales bacterium]|tara:strand:- start:3618 stop:4745 length:1128 start_codon:yes stop_codon:yes gene_type:complete